MEPQIQYATTKDGVSIAYAEAGDGSPIIRLGPPGVTHVQRDWAMWPGFQPLARAFRLIWYDPRGTGLSDRDAVDFTMPSMITDLEAVVEGAGVDSFTLLSFSDSVPIAVTYAATFPERVSHLILVDGWIKRSDYANDNPAFAAHLALVEQDWTLYTETVARVLIGIDDQRLVESFGEHMRACVVQEAYRAFGRALDDYDVSALLPDISMPTLVLHNDESRFPPIRAGQKLAAGIPGSRFLAIDDINLERIASRIEDFLGAGARSSSKEPSAFATVLFTDLVGHTEMMQRLGDDGGRDVLREHERITRDILKQHSGSEVKTMGDGFMASFGSVTQAIDCAISLQQAFADHNATSPEPLHVRVGLNAGEPIEEDGDLFGSTVILASRIAAKAGGGEILIPEPLRHLLTGKSYVYADRGETMLKGFEDAVRLFEVRWRG